MKSHRLFSKYHRTRHSPQGAFSLIEVTLALGIIAFAMIPLVGLLSTGLNVQKQATDQARAVQVQGSASSAIWGVRKTETGSEFLKPLQGVPVGATESKLGWTEQGTFVLENDSSFNRRGSVVILQPTALGAVQGRSVFISVAWPATARWEMGKWTKADGFVETVVYFNVPEN